MAVNQGSIATHGLHSLPSFAQAFSNRSLSIISATNNSLPPIQTRLPAMEPRRVNSSPTSEDISTQKNLSRKRSHHDITSNTRDDDRPNSDRLVHIKEEDHDALNSSPPPPPTRIPAPEDAAGFSPTSLGPTPSKKRRVTVSGPPHPLNTDVRISNDQTCSTPISPVVMGFTIQRDNPSAIEQVKSMITVKQKQKALIEQRRGSIAGMTSPTTVTAHPAPPSPQERGVLPAKPPPPVRSSRRSPTMGTSSRRPGGNTGHSVGSGRLSPPPSAAGAGQHQATVHTPVTSAHSLPPPPISFARRRAELLGKGKKKPADILISPREAQPPEQFQLAIQSAPPVQTSFSIGKFPMALPRLPSAMGGGDNVRRVAGNVPPTPTRFSIQHNPPNIIPQSMTSISGRSPPAASVPIASTLVPPTPSFHHTEFTGDKAAFLAPFEVFYDALHDSKQLKTWLGDQLQRSNTLIQTLTQQQEKLDEHVEGLVEKKIAGMRFEISGLHRRIEELEESLRVARGQNSGVTKQQQELPALRNGVNGGSSTSEHYSFPSIASSSKDGSQRRPMSERKLSPRQGPERGHPTDTRDSPEVQNASPRPSDHSHPRTQPAELSQSRSASATQSPSQGFRDSLDITHTSHGKPERSDLSRQSSGLAATEQQIITSPPMRRSGSRTNNTAIMSPPDAPGNNS